MNSISRDLRRRALQKIGVLSAMSSNESFENSDLSRLCKSCAPPRPTSNGFLSGVLQTLAPVSRVPMVSGKFYYIYERADLAMFSRPYENWKSSLLFAKQPHSCGRYRAQPHY